MALSKTAAIKEARSLVSLPHRRSPTDYVVYAPWDCSKPHGARTELQASYYHYALAMRTRKVARIALHLMEVEISEDASYALAWDHKGSVEHLVNKALNA